MTSALKKAAEKEAFNECLELNSSRDRLKQRERGWSGSVLYPETYRSVIILKKRLFKCVGGCGRFENYSTIHFLRFVTSIQTTS